MPLAMGIIGCGTHAIHHSNNYNKYFYTEGVWDPNKDVMAKIETKIQCGKKFNSLEELLSNTNIDAVMICSPDEYHLDQIKMALNAGKHVFCEKPLIVPGQEMSSLEEMFDLAAKNELVLTSCHPRRYDKPVTWFRDGMFRLDPEFPRRFGKVINFSFDFSYHEPSTEWKHDRSLLLDHINHEVDLMNCFFGISGFNAWKLHDSFDHYSVVGKRDDGITFHFQGTRRLTAEKYPEWCRVRFEHGEIVLDMMMGLAYILDHENSRTEIIPNLSIDYSGRLVGVMRDFAGQINSDWQGYLTRQEMLMNTEAGIILQNEGVQRISVRT